jgi:vesicle coat complex subunit
MDLNSGHDVREALALGTLGNIGSASLAKDLGANVMAKALSENSRSVPIYVRKKACLCLLSFLRRHKQIYDKQRWIEGLQVLLKCNNYGLLLSAVSLLRGTIKIVGTDGYEVLMP